MNTYNINSYVNRQMIEDLEEYKKINSSCYYGYKFKNKKDLKFVKDNFISVYENSDIIYFSTNDKIIRKIKLHVLYNDKLGDRLLKVLLKSKLSDYEDIITCQLGEELANVIDLNILRKLKKTYKNNS